MFLLFLVILFPIWLIAILVKTVIFQPWQAAVIAVVGVALYLYDH